MHKILCQKDTPLLFLTLSIKLLHRLTLMDHKRALPTLTQLDYWTLLVELINVQALEELEGHENRIIIKNMKSSILRDYDNGQKDMVILALNSIIEFVFEGFKRDAQLANMLVKTTKLMNNIFETLTFIIDSFNNNNRQSSFPL